jgi:manganese/zinc/iron transport system substrate-binding protein
MKKLSIFLISIIFISLSACSNDSITNGQEGKIQVVATIAQIGDVVKEVGGEHVNVTSLMGPGTDPHLYKAVHSDIEAMTNADIIFYNGLNLEGNMNEMFAEMGKSKPTIAVAETIPVHELIADPTNPDIPDPHVWFDIELWQYTVETLRDELIQLDSDHKADFEKNADAYLAKLDELHLYALEKISEIPEESRVLVTAHDAFSYFGEAYGLEVMGLQGLSTESEYSLNDIQRIIDVLVERNIKAVFIESSISERSIQAVVEGAKEKGHDVIIGGELYSDAMGEEDTEEGTYIGMFRHNIDTIVESLK